MIATFLTKQDNDMAKKPKTAVSVKSGSNLVSELDALCGTLGLEQEKTYRPVPSGINVLDYYNGRFFADHENPGQYLLYTGIPRGKMIMVIGHTGAGKTTLSVQAGMNIVCEYDSGTLYHFDLENAYSEDRVADITGLDISVVRNKYRRFTQTPLEVIYTFVKKIRETKLKMMEDPNSPIWVDDTITGEKIPAPTVVIIDTVAALQSNDVMNETEMGSLMFESGSQAKANNAFAQRLSGMIGKANITVIAVNHIRDAIQQGPVRKAKRVQYLSADETCPGGTGFPQFADYFLKLSPQESLTNKIDEGFAIHGKIVRGTIVKSRLSYDGRQFDLVLSDRGMDNAWCNLLFLKNLKQIKGAGAFLYIEAPDGRQTAKFAQRNFSDMYYGDAEFREIVDARLLYEFEGIIPQPGSSDEAALLEAAKAAEADDAEVVEE